MGNRRNFCQDESDDSGCHMFYDCPNYAKCMGGIKPTQPDNKRRRVVTIRVSPDELAIIMLAAQRDKLNVSEFIRRRILIDIEREDNETWDGKRWIRSEKAG